MTYLKHNNAAKKSAAPKNRNAEQSAPARLVVTGPDVPGYTPSPSMQHDINHVAGLGDIEASLDWIATGISKLTSDDFRVGLYLAQGENVHPVKVTLADNDFDDTMDRLVTAFERIADSVARLAGLNRPRLESWHGQDEYEPRYKDDYKDGA